MSEDLEMATHPADALLRALVDEIECGLLVCAGDGRVQLANESARRELDDGIALRSDNGNLVACGGGSEPLMQAIRQAAQADRRSLVRVGREGDGLMVGVQPLGDPQTGARLALVLLGRRVLCSDLSLELLASQAGLTLMERRVLAALLRDSSPGEIAASHEVALSTVRTQIASIREKVGVRSIDHLLLRAAALPSFASALRMSRTCSGCADFRRAA
jgi:DNA-binding CsgD family transcriptional regulator